MLGKTKEFNNEIVELIENSIIQRKGDICET